MMRFKHLEPNNDRSRRDMERFCCHRLSFASECDDADLLDMELHHLGCASFIECWRAHGGGAVRMGNVHNGDCCIFDAIGDLGRLATWSDHLLTTPMVTCCPSRIDATAASARLGAVMVPCQCPDAKATGTKGGALAASA